MHKLLKQYIKKPEPIQALFTLNKSVHNHNTSRISNLNNKYKDFIGYASNFNKALYGYDENVVSSKIPSLTLTSHPTNLSFGYKDKNGSNRRPFLWEEIKHYYSLISKNSLPQNTNTWIGYDMDRHQDEQSNIFIFTFLQNMRASLIQQGITENVSIIADVDKLSDTLEQSFNNVNATEAVNISNSLKLIAEKLQKLQWVGNPYGLNGQYRISSEDLESKEGQQKIHNRLQEIKQIKNIFGYTAISEVIIADCTTVEQIDVLKQILQENHLQTINVTPLVEEHLDDKTLQNIIQKADSKVMLAGSDSIQRDTYIGALLMKVKIQSLIHQYNQENPHSKKTFFEGAGSTINRNGCILPSRMGTILEGMPYERTIQGQEAEQLISNNNHRNVTIRDLQSSRCTVKDIEVAEPILQQVMNEVSLYQKKLQTEPQYTNAFDKEQIFNIVQENSHYGSRAKKPTDVNKFEIKSQRAITQSMIHNKMHFQPEMMYWDIMSSNLKDKIKENIHNPIIKDFLNQYTALWQSCDLDESQKWITDKNLYKGFKASYNAFKGFVDEISNVPNYPKDLLLHNLDDHRPRFNLNNMDKEKTNDYMMNFRKTTSLGSSPKTQSLLQIKGCGYSTFNLL